MKSIKDKFSEEPDESKHKMMQITFKFPCPLKLSMPDKGVIDAAVTKQQMRDMVNDNCSVINMGEVNNTNDLVHCLAKCQDILRHCVQSQYETLLEKDYPESEQEFFKHNILTAFTGNLVFSSIIKALGYERDESDDDDTESDGIPTPASPTNH